ncbi:hypothetical protein CLOM_g3829 [Closterium sp. NIES-68]|nr:hypothetical protein CLOM_g3829 [Closterium sp. NIES-68]GJP68141.1 hypothetical protein CLOP_g24881 [Closterium sp. NIES-67]GJP70938.1 hypothetical protein CLOP_g1829 [Closterium sp. NIES-67]
MAANDSRDSTNAEAMAAAETAICDHCARPIPVANLPLHMAHCETRLVRCDGCDEMVATAAMDQHVAAVHAPAPCSLCGEVMEHRLLPAHEASSCALRPLICPFCDLPVTAMDFTPHTDVCGSRTDKCDICSKYVLKRDQPEHHKEHQQPLDSASTGASTSGPTSLNQPRDASGHSGGIGGYWHLLVPVGVVVVGVALALGVQKRNKR